MAFDIKSFLQDTAGHVSLLPREWNYKTDDSVAVVQAAGYFNEVSDRLEVGDLLNVYFVGENLLIPYFIGAITAGVVVLLKVASSSNLLLETQIVDISTAGTSFNIVGFDQNNAIVDIRLVLDGTIATADATVTFEINGTPIVGGDIPISVAASGAGVVFSSTPTSANVVGVNDIVSSITNGASTGVVKANIVMFLQPVVV